MAGYVVSNGSFQAGRGTATWIIEGCMNKNQLIGMCISLSNADKHRSFCSELAGIYATLFTLSTLLPTNIEKSMVRMACDGKSVILHLWWTHIMDLAKPHANLISAARHLMQHGTIKVDLFHVKGHKMPRVLAHSPKMPPWTSKLTNWQKPNWKHTGQVPLCSTSHEAKGCAIQAPKELKKTLPTIFRTTLMANGWPTIGSRGGILLRASGIQLTGIPLGGCYRNYPLIVATGSPNMYWAILQLEKTWKDGTFGHQCNAHNVRNHRKISTIFLSVPLQLLGYYGKNL